MDQLVFIDMGQKAQGFQGDLLKVVFIDILLHKTAFSGGFLGRRCQKVLAGMPGNIQKEQLQKLLADHPAVRFFQTRLRNHLRQAV